MDSVADFLTRIRNGLQADHDDVMVPSSRLGKEIARLLKEEGYIEDIAVERARRSGSSRPTEAEFEWLRIKLKYTEDREPVISGLERVSKPGRRRYATAGELPRVLGGMGTAIMTTSRGVMTANEARRQHVGGEVLAYVW